MLMIFCTDSAGNNQGYDGTLTIANIPEKFAVECLGEVLDEEDKVVTEKSNSVGKKFALMFEFDGDVKAIRHVLYCCSANRPTISSSTQTNAKEPNTNELAFVISVQELQIYVLNLGHQHQHQNQYMIIGIKKYMRKQILH